MSDHRGTNRPTLSAGGHVVTGGSPYVARVEIADIRLPDNHCAMNLDAVTAYAKLLRAGHTPPPPLVTPNADGDGYWLLDGRHRFIAHIAAGESSMTVLCTDGATIQHP